MKTTFTISAVLGLFFALIFQLLLQDWWLSLRLGILFAILLFFAIEIILKRDAKRYKMAEEMITVPIWHRLSGNITTPNGVRNARIYFTIAGIVFISLDKKPYLAEELHLSMIDSYEVDDTKTVLIIRTTDERLYAIRSAEVKDLLPRLAEHGWTPPQD